MFYIKNGAVGRLRTYKGHMLCRALSPRFTRWELCQFAHDRNYIIFKNSIKVNYIITLFVPTLLTGPVIKVLKDSVNLGSSAWCTPVL